MNWIEEHRLSLGLSREAFARAITRELGGSGENRKTVPAVLIYMLEKWPSCYTHPNLINMIAHACGASKAQRDMFLHPSRRSSPYRQSDAAITRETVQSWHKRPGAGAQAGREGAADHATGQTVVVIDREGNVIYRARSAYEAESLTGLGAKQILKYCNHQVEKEFLRKNPYIYRFAKEWDAMTPSARAVAVRSALQSGQSGRGAYSLRGRFRKVVALSRDGRELARYESAVEAAQGELVSSTSVRWRCERRTKKEFTADAEITFRYADEWDRMTAKERLKDLGAAL